MARPTKPTPRMTSARCCHPRRASWELGHQRRAGSACMRRVRRAAFCEQLRILRAREEQKALTRGVGRSAARGAVRLAQLRVLMPLHSAVCRAHCIGQDGGCVHVSAERAERWQFPRLARRRRCFCAGWRQVARRGENRAHAGWERWQRGSDGGGACHGRFWDPDHRLRAVGSSRAAACQCCACGRRWRGRRALLEPLHALLVLLMLSIRTQECRAIRRLELLPPARGIRVGDWVGSACAGRAPRARAQTRVRRTCSGTKPARIAVAGPAAQQAASVSACAAMASR